MKMKVENFVFFFHFPRFDSFAGCPGVFSLKNFIHSLQRRISAKNLRKRERISRENVGAGDRAGAKLLV